MDQEEIESHHGYRDDEHRAVLLVEHISNTCIGRIHDQADYEENCAKQIDLMFHAHFVLFQGLFHTLGLFHIPQPLPFRLCSRINLGFPYGSSGQPILTRACGALPLQSILILVLFLVYPTFHSCITSGPRGQ